MKLALIVAAAGIGAYGATFTISPAINYECNDGQATESFTWSGAPGPVEIRILKPDGPSMTGVVAGDGMVSSGDWVTDGMQFFLISGSTVLAQVTAQVRCGATPRTVDTGLADGSYFPLQVGNTWIYRYNNRLITNDYVVQTITGAEMHNGLTYYVVTDTYPGPSVVAKLRGDNNGVIYAFTGSGEQVYIDPNNTKSAGRYTGLLGTFDNSIVFNSIQGLESISTTYVAGIGMVSTTSSLMTGSSGGFDGGLDLIEARIDGVVLAQPSARLSLSIQNPVLDLTNQLAPNCKVPCYFAACGIAGADDPNTYRPCAQTRIESSYSGPHSVQLQFFTPSGSLQYQTTAQVGADGGVEYLRLPLYTNQANTNTPVNLPPGTYRLAARLLVQGVELGQDSLTVVIN
jgi:hypothetical protein